MQICDVLVAVAVVVAKAPYCFADDGKEIDKNVHVQSVQSNCLLICKFVTFLLPSPLSLRSLIDRMHKWRPKQYSFVSVLIRLPILALK